MTELKAAASHTTRRWIAGGPAIGDSLVIAASVPSLEEYADRLARMAREAGEETSEGEALEVAHEIRATMLGTLEKSLAGAADEA